jgi:isopenicillin N synthase-like dioxygenase
MTANTRAPGGIPIIDIGPFRTGTAAMKAAVSAQVADACENIGFFCITNHGIPEDAFLDAFTVSRAFFDLPLDEKRRYTPVGEVAPRGYAAMETKGLAATLDAAVPKDLREQFMLGTLAPMPRALVGLPGAAGCYAPNIWPEDPASYREIFTTLYRRCETLADTLMRIFARGLDLPEEYFTDKIDHHFSVLGSNHYPELEHDPLPGQLRVGAHSDFGSLTILAPTEAQGGLQVKMADGRWIDVNPIPGCLIINLGDMTARWTNDRWKSTLHRVVNPPDGAGVRSRRQSIAFFCHPNYDAEIRCIESCASPGVPPKYPPIMAGEHMRIKMQKR